MTRHQIFISYHHANDQYYKERLFELNDAYDPKLFIDASVDTNDIDDSLTDETIRQKIRDEYLRASTVTILLVGTETKNRKHIDWELYSSMINGQRNKKSGILVIMLPSTKCVHYTAAHPDEKDVVYPDCKSWTSVTERSGYESRYPHMPTRIIDNLLAPNAKISVTTWDRIENNSSVLKLLIKGAFQSKLTNDYDLTRPMRRVNS